MFVAGSEDAPEDAQTSSVAKAFALLNAFRGPAPTVGVSELARRAGLWKSTAHRLLRELEAAGFVERDGNGYRLGMQLFELGVRVGAYRPNGIRDLAIHELSRLHVHTGLVAHLAVLEDSEVVYLEKVHDGLPGHVARPVTAPGVRVPATCTALGKALLAFAPPEVLGEQFRTKMPRLTAYSITVPGRLVRELDSVRTTGVAYEREELAIGLTAAAAPILVHDSAIAALSLSGPAHEVRLDRVGLLVRDAARRIGARMDASFELDR